MELKKHIKSLLLYEDMTITELAERLSVKLGRKVSRQGLSNKLTRKTLKHTEACEIFDILGYDFKLIKRK